MCLAQQPKIFLLDEPTNHLDLAHQLSILDLIARLNRAGGLAVVAVFHDLNLAAEYCDRLVLLQNGCVAEMGAQWKLLRKRPSSVFTGSMLPCSVTVSLNDRTWF